MKKTLNILLIILPSLIPTLTAAQQLSEEVRNEIGKYLTQEAAKSYSIGKIAIDSSVVDKKEIKLFANQSLSYFSLNNKNVKELYEGVRERIPAEYRNRKLEIYTDNRLLEELTTLSKKKRNTQPAREKALITNSSRPYIPEKGLQNRHIALWQSHGYYFEPKLNRWEWQRARIFQTVEDLYTQSYVLPFLVPMLENAGANVLIPRERDFQTNEVIIDFEKSSENSRYGETNRKQSWKTGATPGFAHLKEQYVDNENPFQEGTFRTIETVRKKQEASVAEWIPDIPEAGRYAVYVSYQSLTNSADDALYTIHHKGGTTHFKVNQKMSGGTWVYLGHFNFDEGMNPEMKVTLSNVSSKSGRTVTADAVKIGGGIGNIARKIKEHPYSNYETSNYPRFTEASRYWLQWAGIPDSVYSASKGENDYTDDYRSRGRWVNYISGGSSRNPKQEGLRVPVDMAFAFHTDAGTTLTDSVIGTLGIFSTNGDPYYKADRYISRDLTDLIMTNIVHDIRVQYEPEWERRGMWNKQYNEAYVPLVPTMLLELLSHQNFADMRYGLDPQFRFTVSRAIYKGMLEFLANQYGTEYVVQPLPVDHFSAEFTGNKEIELKWQPVIDSLEVTATPEKYIVYTRIGDRDFDNGVIANEPRYTTTLEPGVHYSFKVSAVNKGGESFPSEILSAYKAPNEKGTVLIVNGFDRISAPASFVSGDRAGFSDQQDFGVPYLYDISYIGSQNEFRREIPWMDDDAAGFGASWANFEKEAIAGNTFDYPAVHGRAIGENGYSYVSASDEAVMDGSVKLTPYKTVDLIMGKEKEVVKSRTTGRTDFKTFPLPLQQALTDFTAKGGNLFVSGAYIASDLWDKAAADSTDTAFARNVLRYKWRTDQAALTGKVKSVSSPFSEFKGTYQFFNTPNSTMYHVESPDALEPADDKGFTIFRYSENNLSAGIASAGDYRTVILGFPFETLKNRTERNELMKQVLEFLNQ